jgi:hypothetical protein
MVPDFHTLFHSVSGDVSSTPKRNLAAGDIARRSELCEHRGLSDHCVRSAVSLRNRASSNRP